MIINKFKTVKLLDIATAERAKKGNVYPAGSMLIALSATKGDILYLHNDSEVDTRYAVVTPNNDNDSYYVYQMTLLSFDSFLRKWRTGINIMFENLKFLEIPLHDYETQLEISKMMKYLDSAIEKEEKLIEIEKQRKKYFLEKMFV